MTVYNIYLFPDSKLKPHRGFEGTWTTLSCGPKFVTGVRMKFYPGGFGKDDRGATDLEMECEDNLKITNTLYQPTK